MVSRTPLCSSDGESRKMAALDLLAAKHQAVIIQARRAFLETLLERGQASADDVQAAVVLPSGVNSKCLGSVPGTLAKQGIIVRDGYAPTKRREAHARPVSVWRLRDRAAAEAWLLAHPPAPMNVGGRQMQLFDAHEEGAAGGNR